VGGTAHSTGHARGYRGGGGVLAFERYCHHQYCMVCVIKRRVGGGAYIAQWYCNSIVVG